MKTAKIEITAPTLTHERCQYRTPTGRQCARRVLDFESSYCPKHIASQLNDFDDIAPALTQNACKFLNAQGINYSLAALYKLLASGRISPRRASTLAYISSLLLRSLNAIDNDPHPNAGKDPAQPQSANGMSQGVVQGTITIKGKSVNFEMPVENPGSLPRGIIINGKKVNLAPPPTHTRVEPPIPPGKTPMPATRKEFAQQVLAHLKQNESDLPAYTLNNPIYKKLMSNLPSTPPVTTPPESHPAPPPLSSA